MKKLLLLSLIFCAAACADKKAVSTVNNDNSTVAVPTPPPPPEPDFSNLVDLSTPEGTAKHVLKCATSGNFSQLRGVCSAGADSSAQYVCKLFWKTSVEQKAFLATYEYNQISGSALFAADGKSATVDFQYGLNKDKSQTMQLVKQANDYWYLKKF